MTTPSPQELFAQDAFTKACPRSAELGYICSSLIRANQEGIHHTVLYEWDPSWPNNHGFYHRITTNWLTAGICVAQTPLEQGVVVGERGEVYLVGSGEEHEEQIPGVESVGILRGAKSIEGLPHAVGMSRQVYRRVDANTWVELSEPIRPPAPELVGFESIHGFNLDEMYAVGWGGEIWRYVRGTWQEIASPTNVILTDVCCGEDGAVYICGQQGLVLRGRADQWEVLDTSRYRMDFWSINFFKGRLYVAGLGMLLKLEDDLFVPVTEVGPCSGTFGYLSSTPDVLWSTGASDLLSFDGTTWTRLR